MSGVKIAGSPSGTANFTLTPPAGTSVDRVVTLPDRTGNLMMDGPAFIAYPGVAQNVTGDNVFRVIGFDSKTQDTAGCYNNTAAAVGGIPAYSFMPNVPGTYLIGCSLSANLSADNYNSLTIFRNGAQYRSGGPVASGAAAGLYAGLVVLAPVVFNGTTDYVDVRLSFNSQPTAGAVRTTMAGAAGSAFWGFLVRGA